MKHNWELCVYVHVYVHLWDQQGRQHIRDEMREGGQVEGESSDQNSLNTKEFLWELEGIGEENGWRERVWDLTSLLLLMYCLEGRVCRKA